MLDSVRRRMPDLAASLTQWLIALDGELRFSRDVTLALVRAGLVLAPELDRHLADVLASNADEAPIDESLLALRRAAVDFAASLFSLGLAERGSGLRARRRCVAPRVAPHRSSCVVPLGEFSRSLAALAALASSKRAPAALTQLVDEVRRSGVMGVAAAISAIVGRVPVGAFASGASRQSRQSRRSRRSSADRRRSDAARRRDAGARPGAVRAAL